MRRRRAELVVLSCGALFALVLVFSFRPGRRPASGRGKQGPAAAAAEARGEATTLLDGFDFTEQVGGRPLMRIKADRTVGYGPGAGLAPDLYAGENVALTVYPEDGAPVTVHSERAEYDERTRESRLSGNVRWTDGDGSLAETAEVLFHPSARVLEAPRQVHFTKGSIDLTAPSARYEVNERVVRFAGPIDGAGSGEDTGGFTKLTARQGLFRRDQGVLELESFEGQSRTGDRFAADQLTVKTGSSGGRTEWIRGTGNVRGILISEGPAGAGAPGRLERQYSGEQSTLSLDAAGKPRALSLVGAPALLWEPSRRLTAERIEVDFRDGRAAAARASGDVRMDGAAQHAESQRANVGFSKEGAAENAQLEGNVRVQADERRAEGARAVELSSRGIWLLTGDLARSARVESGGSRLSADRIEIDRARQLVRGEGKARAIFAPEPGRKNAAVTFVGDPKRPTYGKADRMVLDDVNHQAVLSGSASLWQDNSSLFADDITLSDADRTVTAVQNVRTVLTPDRRAGSEDRGTSIITSRRLLYRDTERSGRFEGGVTVTRSGGWRASGGESTAWLGKDGGVDCVEISGNVDLADRGSGRTAKAEKAVDYPAQGKTILWGDPARVTDAGGNRVAGAVLTILDRGRSVEVTAPEGGKTETIHRTDKD